VCGVFGAVIPGGDAARSPRSGSSRSSTGQESAGIAASDGEQLMLYKDLGLVAQVLDDRRLPSLPAGWPSPTAATRRPARPSGRMPSPRCAWALAGRWRSATTATS